jgi:hypothetical protein
MTGKPVALKYIPKVLKHLFFTKQVLREIAILNRLQQMKGKHLIIQLLDIISPTTIEPENDFVFLVLEFCATDLRHYLDRVQRRNLPLNEQNVI